MRAGLSSCARTKNLGQLLAIYKARLLKNRYRFSVAKREAVLSTVPPAETAELTLYGGAEALGPAHLSGDLGVPFGAQRLLSKAHLDELWQIYQPG